MTTAIIHFFCVPMLRASLFAGSYLFALASVHASDSFLPPEVSFSRLDVAPVAGQSQLSGLVKSRQYDNVWWAHNDSGNAAELFPIDSAGKLMPLFWGERDRGEGIKVLDADNIDWEDIAIADGWIYVADIGNNGNARRDLGVYVIAEPNPKATETLRALAYVPVVYPEQEQFPATTLHYDAESLFSDGNSLFIITKHRSSWDKLMPGAHLYVLDLTSISPLLPNPLLRIDAHPDIGAATAGDLSPNGAWLAVLSEQKLWFFARPNDGVHWFTGASEFEFSVRLPRGIGEAEAVAWNDDQTLRIVTKNDGQLYSVGFSSPLPFRSRER